MFCPDQCADLGLVINPTGGCPPTNIRKRHIARLAFMACGIALPSEYTKATVEPLFTGNTAVIALSSPLANVQLEDPTTEQIVVHDCMPALEEITGRKLTAEDRIAITTVLQGGGTNSFADFDFWKDKSGKWLRMAFGVAWCNGDFKFLRDSGGSLASGTLQVHSAYQRLSGNGAGSGSVEFTKVVLNMAGDPFSFATPDFNLNTLGINV